MSIASDDEAGGEELFWCSDMAVFGPMWKLGRDDGDAAVDGTCRTGDDSSSDDRLRVNVRLAVVFGSGGSSCGWQSSCSGDSCPVVEKDN